VWKAETLRREDAVGLVLTHRSPDGDEGYPGNLDCTVTYWVTRDKTLEIEYEAVTDKATPVNLTNHSYFNLDGHGSGAILNQALAIYAEYMTPVDSTLIPTGELRPVAGTPLDFRTPVAIGARIDTADEQLRFGKGYDHNFVIEKDPQGRMKRAARAHSARSGRVLECWTTEPGVQFYCGNFLDGSDVGKGGVVYHHRNAFCLETQHFPNSPNQPSFPTTILRPGEKYDSKTVYRFSAE
jgi:aldose 1-epimerase